jgi:hypothetical protein
MDRLTMAGKRAELDAIIKEIESERNRRILPEPKIWLMRSERQLLLERELAADAGDEYADELRIDHVVGDEWYVVSTSSRETSVICGDVNANNSVLFYFAYTDETRLRGDDDVERNPLVGKGLGPYGLYMVKNSRWKRELLDAASSEGPERVEWASGFEHFILRGKGGELSCLARGYEERLLSEGILSIRERAAFWKKLIE